MKFEELSPAERLIAEHAVLNLRTLNNACDMAADGTVLAIAETLAVEQGRELTRKTLQASIDAQVDGVEKKSSPARACECGLKKAHHGRKAREQMTCAGEIRLSRIYLKCIRCGDGGYAADDRLGVAGRYSTGAERLACLAAASWSYQVSSQRLDELCGIRIAENTIRNIAQKHGAAMNAWQNSDPEACREFRETDGFTEFTTDGTCVNTLEGWREMKVGIFAKRAAGDPATADEWADRNLPSPSVSVAFSAIEASGRFGRRWKQWARRLGILDTSNITVLADGAKWIWEEQLNHLRGASGVLDIYHALQHIAETSRVLLGGGTDEAAAWLEEGRTVLIAEGWPGISSFIDATRRPLRSPAKRESLDGLKAYLGSHCDHLNYADRLAKGQSIGSGQIEGACKNLIGRRLKQTGARWRVRRVNRMAGLCANMYSKQWNAYWNSLLI